MDRQDGAADERPSVDQLTRAKEYRHEGPKTPRRCRGDSCGISRGNFKYYATQKIPSKNGEKLKLKTYSAKICGFMVTDTSDPYGLGYGAPAKNPDFQTWKVYLLTPGTAIIVDP